MIPSAGDVARTRLLVVGVIRALGVLFLIFSVRSRANLSLYVIGGMASGLASSSWFWNFGIMGVAEGVGSVVLWMAAPWIANRAVRVPDHARCPRCEYTLSHLTEARCPECGLELEPEFLTGARGPADRRGSPPTPPTAPAPPSAVRGSRVAVRSQDPIA